MKATDLMIGDWVQWNGIPSRVHTITAAEEIRLSNAMELSELTCMYNFNNVEPINLTEEILKANGIDIFDNCDLSLPLYTMGIKVIERGVYIKMQFKFVHELQHALRLCGLDELADNFKIE